VKYFSDLEVFHRFVMLEEFVPIQINLPPPPVRRELRCDFYIFQFHKIAACTALFFSLLHTVGHIVNFYHVSTQPVEHLRCLTSEVHFPSDYKPGITFWLFQTITG
jgi:dual oxidase